LLYLVDYIDEEAHIYCKDGSWQPFMSCYKDWGKVLTADWDEIWKIKESLPVRYSDSTDYHINRYTNRNIYLLVRRSENVNCDYNFTSVRKLYADSMSKAERYFGKLEEDNFIIHISDISHYEISVEEVESLELESY
jgi:hypothetical protein